MIIHEECMCPKTKLSFSQSYWSEPQTICWYLLTFNWRNLLLSQIHNGGPFESLDKGVLSLFLFLHFMFLPFFLTLSLSHTLKISLSLTHSHRTLINICTRVCCRAKSMPQGTKSTLSCIQPWYTLFESVKNCKKK